MKKPKKLLFLGIVLGTATSVAAVVGITMLVQSRKTNDTQGLNTFAAEEAQFVNLKAKMASKNIDQAKLKKIKKNDFLALFRFKEDEVALTNFYDLYTLSMTKERAAKNVYWENIEDHLGQRKIIIRLKFIHDKEKDNIRFFAIEIPYSFFNEETTNEKTPIADALPSLEVPQDSSSVDDTNPQGAESKEAQVANPDIQQAEKGKEAQPAEETFPESHSEASSNDETQSSQEKDPDNYQEDIPQEEQAQPSEGSDEAQERVSTTDEAPQEKNPDASSTPHASSESAESETLVSLTFKENPFRELAKSCYTIDELLAEISANFPKEEYLTLENVENIENFANELTWNFIKVNNSNLKITFQLQNLHFSNQQKTLELEIANLQFKRVLDNDFQFVESSFRAKALNSPHMADLLSKLNNTEQDVAEKAGSFLVFKNNFNAEQIFKSLKAEYYFEEDKLKLTFAFWRNYNSDTNANFTVEVSNLRFSVEEVPTSINFDTTYYQSINREQIPYSVSENDLEKGIQFPLSTPHTKYFLDITKDNDHGKIILKAIRRSLRENYLNQAEPFSHTEILKTLELEGFEAMSTRDIVAERTLSIYQVPSIHSKTAKRETLEYEDYKRIKQIRQGKNNAAWYRFKPLATGFVLAKAQDKAVYYIATNKHVVNATPQVPDLEGSLDYDGRPFHTVSLFDQIHNREKLKDYNYKGLLTFVQKKDHDPAFDGRVKLETEHALNFEAQNEERGDTILSIKIAADFSRPMVTRWNFDTYSRNLNDDYSKLVAYNLSKNLHVALDMIVLRVEFNPELDPFQSWWTKRPTFSRNLSTKDVFNLGSNWDQYPNESNPRISYYHYSQRRFPDDAFHIGPSLETGVSLENKVITASYPQYRNSKTKKQNYHLLYSDNGLSEIIINHQILTFNEFFYRGWVSYQEGENQGPGASGSPIFDKNLNLMGILWGGTPDQPLSSLGGSNSIAYFGSEFDYDYLDFQSNNPLVDKRMMIPNYSYVYKNNNDSESYNLQNQAHKIFQDELEIHHN